MVDGGQTGFVVDDDGGLVKTIFNIATGVLFAEGGCLMELKWLEIYGSHANKTFVSMCNCTWWDLNNSKKYFAKCTSVMQLEFSDSRGERMCGLALDAIRN